MKSGVKTEIPNSAAKAKTVLAAQDDRSNGVRRDCLQVVIAMTAGGLSDEGGGIN